MTSAGVVLGGHVVPILKTKLCPSFVSSRLLPRERLLELLPPSRDVRLVLLHALAGAGKSSLLYDCFERGLLQGAWYSLSEEDRDPFVFFSYLLTTIDESYPGMVTQTLKAFNQPGEPNWEALSTSLINSVFEFGRPVTVVLDDYHLVQSVTAIGDAISKIVRHGPPNLTLVLSTRERPDLPLTNLRAKGRLLELCPEDLLFTQREIGDLFQEIWSIKLDPDMARLLLEKTEGWVTGLHLAAQAIGKRDTAEARTYIEGLQGQDNLVYHYIASEVFETQPPDVQRFLLTTSIPESFTPELASRLSGTDAPLAMLDYLDRARLFLVHLDTRGQWFRYHHLFRDFLQRRLQESGSHSAPQLHAQAARWYLDQQDSVNATWHFLRSDQPRQAADLLEKSGSTMLNNGMHATFQAQLELLPPHLVQDRPQLGLLIADLEELRGNWMVAVEGYQRALSAFRAAGQETDCVAVLEKLSSLYLKYGATEQLLEVCEEGLRSCQEDALRALFSTWLGSALVNSGRDWRRGYSLIVTSHELAHRCGNPRAISWACMAYGFVYHLPRGNFPQAALVLREGIAYFRQLEWPAVIAQLSMNLALVHIVASELDAAEEVVTGALKSATENGFSYAIKGLEILRAMILLGRREFGPAEEILQQVQQADIPGQMKPFFYRTKALVLHFLGHPEPSRVARAEMLKSMEWNGGGFYGPECRLALAFLLWREGLVQEARQDALTALELSRQAEGKFWEMKSHQLLAAITGDRQAVERALSLTDENGYQAHWKTDSWELGAALWRQGLLPADCRLLQPAVPSEPVRAEAPPPEVRIHTLGALEIHNGNEQVFPGPYLRPRVQLLLKYVLANPDRLIPVDQFIEQFWPDRPLAQAKHTLNSCLSMIRKAFKSLLVREGDGYRLATEGNVWMDLRLFREHVDTARRLSRESDTTGAVEMYLKAEKLYRGDFLADEQYQEFILEVRRQTRAQYEGCLEYLADYYSVRGANEEALERYRLALATEVPREKILQKLMHCCAAMGDSQTARDEFELFKRRTADSQGLCLDRSTGALYRRVLKKGGGSRASRPFGH